MKNIFNVVSLNIIFILLISSSSTAQLMSDSWLWTLNLGFTNLKSEATQNTISGYSFNTTIEKKIWRQPLAYGINVSFLSADDQFTISNQGGAISSSISSTAVFLTAKYLFSKSQVVPYIGLGLGLNFATNNIVSTKYDIVQPASDTQSLSSDLTSLAVALPIGVNFFLGENRPYIGFNIVPTWMEKTFFSSNINFLFNLSLGFQF